MIWSMISRVGVYFFYLLLGLLIAGLFIKRKSLCIQFKKISKKTWLILVLLFFAALIIRSLLYPHTHLMWTDEVMYLDAANSIIQGDGPMLCSYIEPDVQECRILPKPPGWAAMLSLGFLFHASSGTAFLMNSIFGSLTVILIFLFSFIFFDKERIALWSAFLLAVYPLHAKWSATAESNIFSVFMVLLSMLLLLIYIRSKDKTMMLCGILSIIMAILVRWENIIIIPIVIGYFLIEKKLLIKRLFIAFYPVLIIVSMLILIGLEYIFLDMTKISIIRLESIFMYLPLFIGTTSMVFILILPAIATFMYKGFDIEKKYLLFGYFILLSIYSPIFYIDRFALMPGIFFILLSSLALAKLRWQSVTLIIIIPLLVLLNISYLEEDYFNSHRLETEVINDIDIPDDAYVVVEHPEVLGFRGFKVVAESDMHKFEQVLYYCGKSCRVRYQSTDDWINKIPALKDREYKIIQKFKGYGFDYYLFNISSSP